MTTEDITLLIERVRRGRDEDAATELWHVYYKRLVDVARRQLGKFPKRVADEEDLASSAMRSFFRAAETGRLDSLESRDGLWKLLLTITIRKTNRHKKHFMAQKRGGQGANSLNEERYRAHEIEDLPAISEQALITELMLECQDLIDSLPVHALREIALLRLEGHTIAEIAEMRGVAKSTIKRKLSRIRESWSEETD